MHIQKKTTNNLNTLHHELVYWTSEVKLDILLTVNVCVTVKPYNIEQSAIG